MRFVILDVFTDTPLTGNQLAVFPDGAEVPEHVRQDLAREIGFSETVFVDAPSHPTSGDARIHIHTPGVEIEFAGHPVLGTAVALAAERSLPGGSVVTLECGIGPVPVELDATATGGWMRQPLPEIEPWPSTDALLAALGIDAAALAAPIDVYDNGLRHAIVAVTDAAVVAGLRPDSSALARAAGEVGVNVCALTSPGAAKTRMFFPANGIVEDAATGSAAGPLAVHLLRHGLVPPGIEVVITQGVEMHRPSQLRARVEGVAERIKAVAVGGEAIIVGEGRFSL